MGIETALLVGGGLVGNYIKKRGEQRAARGQARDISNAGAQSAQTQQQMFNQGQQATQGYRDRGDWAGSQYQNMLTNEGQGQFAEGYMQGPMFGMLQGQAEDATLRNASATGGLRTGQSNVALATIAPQLLQQEYQNRMQGFNQLQGYGAGAAGQTANLAANVGQNVGQTQYNAAIQAAPSKMAANTAMSGFAGDAISTLGGVGYDYLRPNQVATRLGQTYGR